MRNATSSVCGLIPLSSASIILLEVYLHRLMSLMLDVKIYNNSIDR